MMAYHDVMSSNVVALTLNINDQLAFADFPNLQSNRER